MNKFIKEQLSKLKNSEYVIDGDTITFKPLDKNKFQEGNEYKVELSDLLLNKEDTPLLMKNWNEGSIPPSKTLLIKVSKQWGTMIAVDSLVVENNKITTKEWSGWLPINMLKIIKEEK